MSEVHFAKDSGNDDCSDADFFKRTVKQVFENHPASVASIIPIILGLIPRRATWTYLFLITLGRTAVTANIIKNEGRTTANVAIIAPIKPACEVPT